MHNLPMLKRQSLFLSLAALLSACDLAPEMQNVLPTLPEAFRGAPTPAEQQAQAPAPQASEASTAAPADEALPPAEAWKTAEPSDAKDRGAWWEVFGDSALNALQQEALSANQTAAAARARVAAARAFARFEASDLYPGIGIDANASRRGETNANFPDATSPRQKPRNIYSAIGNVSYELDLFGMNRNQAAAATYEAEGEDANYRNTLLGLQADVAEHYFTLRAIDEEMRTLRATLEVREQAEQVMKRRLEAGFTSELDYARAQSELASVRADLFALEKLRAQREHMLALLLGKPASEFTFASAPLEADMQPPAIPPGLPSALLERRPDIAVAQRSLSASNARIGVARAAFFPSVTLGLSGGYESNRSSEVFRWASRSWALGPQIHIPLFEGGSAQANLERRKAEYEEAVANYRQQVLAAFAEVETALSDVRLLTQQLEAQQLATDSARRTAQLSQLRYDQGDLNYLDVVDAKRTQLAAERALAQIKGQRYTATLQLIRALGGGW